MSELVKVIDAIESLPGYKEALDLVRINSDGQIWLIGGSVYRTIASVWHGSQSKIVDFDFIVEKATPNITVPLGWEMKVNSFGNPKFMCGGNVVDFIPVATVKPIVDRNLMPTIENVLAATTLGIQAVAYDVFKKEIFGSVGLGDLEAKIVRVNDRLSFSEYKMPIEQLIKNKAEELGFEAVYPE